VVTDEIISFANSLVLLCMVWCGWKRPFTTLDTGRSAPGGGKTALLLV